MSPRPNFHYLSVVSSHCHGPRSCLNHTTARLVITHPPIRSHRAADKPSEEVKLADHFSSSASGGTLSAAVGEKTATRRDVGGEKLSCTALLCLPIARVRWGALLPRHPPPITRPVARHCVGVGLEQISIKPPKSPDCPSQLKSSASAEDHTQQQHHQWDYQRFSAVCGSAANKCPCIGVTLP